MKSCEEIKEALYYVAFGDADQEQVESVLEHLDTCKECKELFTHLCAISNALGEIKEEEPPEELVKSVMHKIEQIRAKRKRNRRILASFVAAAAVVVIIFATKTPNFFNMGSMVSTTSDTAAEDSIEYSADTETATSVQPRVLESQADAGLKRAGSDDFEKQIAGTYDDGGEAATGMGDADAASENSISVQSMEDSTGFFIKVPSDQTAQEVFLILFVEKDQDITDIQISSEKALQIKEACTENGFEYSNQPYPDGKYLTVTIID